MTRHRYVSGHGKDEKEVFIVDTVPNMPPTLRGITVCDENEATLDMPTVVDLDLAR